MSWLVRPGHHFRFGLPRAIARVALVCALLLAAKPLSADVSITTATTWSSGSATTGNLNITGNGSLNVNGFLDVTGNILNDGTPTGLVVAGSLSCGGNVTNETSNHLTVNGTVSGTITGNLTNRGYLQFGSSVDVESLSVASVTNAAGATLLFRSNATLITSGFLCNAGSVTFDLANVAPISASGSLSNTGSWTVTSGQFTNLGTATNSATGEITVVSGIFANEGTLANTGQLSVGSGTFDNLGVMTNSGTITVAQGDLVNQVGGTATGAGSMTNTSTILLANGNLQNDANGIVTNSGTITVSHGNFENLAGGTVSNSNTISVGAGNFTNQGIADNQSSGKITVTTGNVNNQVGGTLTNSGSITVTTGTYANQGTTNNLSAAKITVTSGNYENQSGGALTNGGSITLSDGDFLNQGSANNQANAKINLTTGSFTCQTGGTLSNSGTIALAAGGYYNQGSTTNQSGGSISVSTLNVENLAGTLTNAGSIAITAGHYANQGTTNNQAGGNITLTTGRLENQTTGVFNNSGNLTIISSGSAANYRVTNYGAINNQAGGRFYLSGGSILNEPYGTITNGGTVTLADGKFDNQGTLTNQSTGVVTLMTGNFDNKSGSSVANDGLMTLDVGDFENRSGSTVTNNGTITLTTGNFVNWTGGSVTNNGTINIVTGLFAVNAGSSLLGEGSLNTGGTVTFFSGTVLQGSQTITASVINLLGTTSPGSNGTVGQLTLNGDVNFQGPIQFDLLASGAPGAGNDQIVITNGNSGVLMQGTEFDFHIANSALHSGRPAVRATHATPPVGSVFQVLTGNFSMSRRPVVLDDSADYRVVMRTNQDVNGFSSQGTAYYAMIARNTPLEQTARSGGGNAGEVLFGRYLDQNLPADDHSIGTLNADMQWIHDSLDLMPNNASVAQALGQMSGQVYVPIASVSLLRQFFAYNQLAARLRADVFEDCSLDRLQDKAGRRSVLAHPYTVAENWIPRGWVSGYAFGGSIAGDANAEGCSYGGGGLQAGFGYQVTEEVDCGMFYDFGSFNLKSQFVNEADGQAHSGGAYLAWHREYDYFLFLGGGGFTDYHSVRYIDFDTPDNEINRLATGKFQGGQAAFYTEYGRNGRWENANLRPYLGLLFMNTMQNAFDETGADALSLHINRSAVSSFRSLFGAQLDFRRNPASYFIWTARTVWVHEYMNTEVDPIRAGLAAFPGNSYTLPRPYSGNDWFIAGCGVRGAFLTNRLRPFLDCDFLMNIRQSLCAGMAGLEYVW